MDNIKRSTAGLTRPDYRGSKDESIRLTIENRFTRSIELKECCGASPLEMFRSNTEYFVKCSKCDRRTKMFKHLYMAKQMWNRELFENQGKE